MVLRRKRCERWRQLMYGTVGTSVIVIVGLLWYNLDGVHNGHSKFSTSVQHKTPLNTFEATSTSITLVTAYFDLGTIQRVGRVKIRTKEDYLRWAKTYQHLENPLVCYTDDSIFFQHMTSMRKGKEHKTKVFKIDRNSTWAFQREPRVREILSQPGYPRYRPHTRTSGYPCATLAKYDVIVRAATANYFKTKYIAWIDVGTFRNRESERSFELKKLESHNESCVAMSKVFNVPLDITPKEIFYGHKQWLAGCLVLGNRETMIRFADQFKRAVDFYLSKNMISADEQVIYAMFSDQGRKEINPDVAIQYDQAIGWFGLSTEMIHEFNNTV